jgi:hypothetical protein
LQPLGTAPQAASPVDILNLYANPIKPAVSNICIDKLNASNMFGWDYQRFMLSCDNGWSRGVVASDVNTTILEDKADVDYNPYEYIGYDHYAYITWGDASRNREITLYWNKLTLNKPSFGSIANYTGQDLAFRNTGNLTVTFK